MDTQATPTLRTLIEDASEHLREFGGRVLPTISTPSNSKMPMLRDGCRAATANVGEVVDAFNRADAYGMGLSATGYAFYPGQDIVVIDRDEKNGKSGRADTDHVAQAIGCPLPETATVQTPSGGDHLYYRLPQGTVLPHVVVGKLGRCIAGPNGKPLPTGVDIFAYHETKSLWVAGPGTTTPKGSYVWRNDAPIALLPQPWIDAIKATKPEKAPRDASRPRPEREAAPLSYVQAVLSAIDPDGLGHDSRFTVRAVVMEAAVLAPSGDEIPEEDKIEMLRAWCARNPRFDDDAFDRSINSIFESREDDTIERAGLGSLQRLAKDHGYSGPPPSVALANANGGNPFTASAAATTPDRFKELVKHFSDALTARGGRALCGKMFGDLDEADAETRPVIKGWINEGDVVAEVGDSGTYKTYAVVNKLMCKATGTPWAKRQGFSGYSVGDATAVAMFAGEGPRGVIRRIKADIAGNERDRSLVEKNLLFVSTVYALNRPEGLAGMAMEIEDKGIRPKLIAVDTFNLALDGNEDSSEEVKKAIAGARALGIMFDAGVLIVDHTGHSDKSRQRGSSAKKANEDGVIICTRPENGDAVTLKQDKNRDADKRDFVVTLRGQKIEVGKDRETGEPITDLWFEAIEPSVAADVRGLFKDQDAGRWVICDIAAKKFLDGYFGLDISATDLARQIIIGEMPDLETAEPEKFSQVCRSYRKHLVGEATMASYVAERTPSGAEASTFRNPNQNGRRTARRATHPAPEMTQ